jgi:hypothetical protein
MKYYESFWIFDEICLTNTLCPHINVHIIDHFIFLFVHLLYTEPFSSFKAVFVLFFDLKHFFTKMINEESSTKFEW